MAIDIASFVERPELLDRCWSLSRLWPTFMLHDPVADLYYDRVESYAATAWAAVDDGALVARAFAVPFAMGEDIGRSELPAAGWDGVIRWAWLDHLAGRAATHLSALEITIDPTYRGSGLAAQLVKAMREAASSQGLAALVAPVRPSRKHEEPSTPMAVYSTRTRSDGLPHDPWLRVHVRLGGRIVGVCPRSMTIAGSLTEWRAWCDLVTDRSGLVEVPGALVPVHVDVEQDHAVYVEPNVWVRHEL